MKASLLLTFIYVGVVHSALLGWKPGRNYLYDVQAKLRSPICDTENGGLVVKYKLIVTAVGPNALHLNPHDFSAVGVDAEYATNSSIIQEIQRYVESPMELTVSQGIVQSAKVDSDLPEWAMEIKKEQAAYFSTDSNGFARPSQSMNNGYAFRSMEPSVHGQCQTKYMVNRINGYNHESDSINQMGVDHQQNSEDASWKGYCNQDDKLYEIVKSTKLYKCNGNSASENKPKFITRYIACGRRSRQQYKILKIQEELTTQDRKEPELMSNLKLVGTNPASPVKKLSQTKTLNDLSKSYSDLQAQTPEPNVDLAKLSASNPKKFILGHMANTPGAVRWALQQGANGVELDLHFSGNQPSEFKHSKGIQPCDCSCACPVGSLCPESSICNYLWKETGSHCTASSTAEAMTMALGGADVRDNLALIYIDNKLSNSMIDFYGSGSNLVKLLNKNVFDRGYRGQVIISGSEVIYTDFLKGAIKAAKESKYADKYFYTFDAEGKDYGKVWDELLQLRTQNIAYATGISICAPVEYHSAITASLKKNAYAGVAIWTLDKPESMKSYLDIGTDGIMTNKPSVAKGLLNPADIATPGNALVRKHVPDPPLVIWQCDCNYHPGGCTISRMAPANRACKCVYKTLQWTCYGETVACKDPNAAICKEPEASLAACKFGGGDCGGYKLQI